MITSNDHVIINHTMEEDLTTSLILRNRKSRFTITNSPLREESPKRHSLTGPSLIIESLRQSNSLTKLSQTLEWQQSDCDQAYQKTQKKVEKTVSKSSKPSQRKEWFGRQEKSQKTLNDKVFNLQQYVQKKVYVFNFIMNVIMRLLFINLLVFLVLEGKTVYLKIFLSLWAVAFSIYIIIMIKMLFTRSDKESVYFQKIFNETEWADIQSQRLMRTHFNAEKIFSKVKVFFNPKTKFEKNTKISFLRQQIFKRMELVIVYFPFAIMFFFNQDDFVSEDKPNFKVYITGGICLEILRTTFTYLVIYIYN